jgi:hypothetical protein
MDVPLIFRIPRAVLTETRRTLAEIGEHGVEGVVLWVASEPADGTAEVLRTLIPYQVALRSEDGLAVTIPDWAVSELILGLEPSSYIPIKVHSHPQDAFHSMTDDLNRILSHRGSISIVVPWFARAELRLSECSVNELGSDFRWRELSADEVERRFIVDG